MEGPLPSTRLPARRADAVQRGFPRRFQNRGHGLWAGGSRATSVPLASRRTPTVPSPEREAPAPRRARHSRPSAAAPVTHPKAHPHTDPTPPRPLLSHRPRRIIVSSHCTPPRFSPPPRPSAPPHATSPDHAPPGGIKMAVAPLPPPLTHS